MKFSAIILFLGLFFTAAFSQATKPRPIAAKPKPAATPQKGSSENDEWDKASAIADTSARVAALKKFVTTFPRSTRIAKASEMISSAEASLGNEKMAAGDIDGAIKSIRAAVKDAPKPMLDQLFTDTLSKFPANLYFRGLRNEGYEIAKVIEDKAEANVSQLLSIAGFYLSVENGSDARRVAESAIKIDPNSSAAYQTRGLANRIDFKLEESAVDYAKALELEPDSLIALRGLAEMKRSLGKADEAAALYREILAKDDANVPARTGLILALFDADKRSDAEAEMAKSLEANPGNVILLAGAAYWYAAHNEGAQAVTYAQKAIETDPRFIWSHIAMGRGLLSQNKPADAERSLLAARKYGNFPTLEYEIASSRLAAGLYREAAEELSKSFSIKDGAIHADLGGRVSADASNFTDLISAERRASLFTPTAADNSANAEQLKVLLEFEQNLRSPEPKTDIAASAADDFIRGDDKMKVHRQIFAASEVLEKKIALPKVIEITQAASANLEAGLDIPEPSTAVMASELYENRAIAAAAGQYINVPNVPRATLSSVLRGRLEEISGWASFQQGDAAQAVVHLKRAVGVLPVDSAWWRSSTWRLGSALSVSGNDTDALEAYIKSYKSSGPDAIRYSTIEALYKRVKGNTEGLEERIGPKSVTPETVAQKVDSTPDLTPSIESTPDGGGKEQAAPTQTQSEVPVAAPVVTAEVPKPATTPAAIPEEIKSLVTPDASPKALLDSTPEAQKTPEKEKQASKDLFPPVIITIPSTENSKAVVKADATAESSPTPDVKAAEPKPTQVPVEKKSDETVAVVEPTPQPTPTIKPCTLTVSDENITLKNTEGVSAVIIGNEGDQDMDGLKAVSMNPDDVSVRRETIDGVKTRALFVLRSTSAKTGTYKVSFEMPCGKREITVKVQ